LVYAGVFLYVTGDWDVTGDWMQAAHMHVAVG
jgi:hypothetical protein